MPATKVPAALQSSIIANDRKSTSSYAIAGYVLVALLFWFALFSRRMRRNNLIKYRSQPDRWLGLAADQFILCEHTLLGIGFVPPHAVMTRAARLLRCVLSLLVMLGVAAIMPLLNGASYQQSSNPVSTERLGEVLLTFVCSTCLSLLFGMPLILWGLTRPNQNARRASMAVGLCAAILLAVLDCALLAMPLLLGGAVRVAATLTVFGLSAVLSFAIFEPATLVVKYNLLAGGAVFVTAGGTGGVFVFNAVGPAPGDDEGADKDGPSADASSALELDVQTTDAADTAQQAHEHASETASVRARSALARPSPRTRTRASPSTAAGRAQR